MNNIHIQEYIIEICILIKVLKIIFIDVIMRHELGLIFSIIVIPFLFLSCEKNEQESISNTQPSDQDTEFTYMISNGNVTFTASRPNYSNEWEFGNGEIDSGYQVSTIYSENGVYNVTLLVSNEFGENSRTKSITINDVGNGGGGSSGDTTGTYTGIIIWSVRKETSSGQLIEYGQYEEPLALDISINNDEYIIEGHPFSSPVNLGPIGNLSYGVWLFDGYENSPIYRVDYNFYPNERFIQVYGMENNLNQGGYQWSLSVSGILSK